MKYINKNQPPDSFLKWKNSENENWQPTWDNFQKPEKASVHNSLLKEQGFICCYCQQRITIKNSHIEHFKPRNQYPDLTLDYNNLIASCQGECETIPLIPVHCGHKKGEWYQENLMVSPLENDCSNFFRYTEDGQILPTTIPNKEAAAKTTIEKLDLNIDKLRKMRSKAIEGCLEDIENLKKSQIKKLIDYFAKPNENDEYEQCVSTIIYILKKYL